MRLRSALTRPCLALLAASLWGASARADDFDDDFGARPPPTPAAAQTSAQPAPSAGSAAPFDDDFGPAPAPPAAAAEHYEVFDRESELAPLPGAASDADDAKYRDDRVRQQSTLEGLVGGVHVLDAGSDSARTFRVGIYGRFLRRKDFLEAGSLTRRSGAVISVGLTPIEHLELAVAFSGTATENDYANPVLVQSLGDTRLSAKGYAAPLRWLRVGGDVALMLLNGVGSIGYQGNATSVLLRGNASFDLREIARPVPLVIRTSLSYLFDNSAKLVSKVEDDRYASLNDAAPRADEYRQLVSRTERFQLGINRVDMLGLAFGFELPLAPAPGFALSPLLEWTLGLPVNRQGFDCVITGVSSDRDSCLAREGFGARPSTLTVGVRGEPGVRGLGLLLAVDVATSGRTTVRELAPNTPYDLIFGLSYAYDTRPPRPVEVVRRVEVPKEVVAERGNLIGEVVDRETQAPVPHAIVRIEGSSMSDLACNEQGRLVSYALDPGTYTLFVSAPDYQDGTCTATLPEGARSAPVHCELEALPRQGAVHGRISGATGEAVANATVELRGPSALTLRTDASGGFEAVTLPPGHYDARVEAEGYLMKATGFDVAPKQDTNVLLSLVPVPKQRLTELRAKDIVIRRQVQFVPNSADIRPQSDPLLAEVADILIRNPELKVEVQGHTDDTGTASRNMELSQARADAVRDWLVRAGVDASRLTAVGYGRTRPLAPNITEANRARNRRVEFVIVGGEAEKP